LSQVRAANERDRIRRADLHRTLNLLKGAPRLALVDMDGTLLDGRFVMALAQRTGREPSLAGLLDNDQLSPTTRTPRIAAVFAGLPKSVFEQVARSLPLKPGAVETVVGLRKAGFVVGIVTDSYRIAAETVRRRVFADFTLSHVLTFRNERTTGRITLCPAMLHPKGCLEHTLCKVNVLEHLREESGVSADQVLAVGDSHNDICLLRTAGDSVPFESRGSDVSGAAQHTVVGDLRGILQLLGLPHPRQAEV